MLVVDASAIIDLLLNRQPNAQAVARRLRAAAPNLAAPHLIDAEVGQVLRRFVLRGEMGADYARTALRDLADLPLTRYPHLPLLERAFALRDNATVYDALYLALAEALRCPLLTADGDLDAIPGHRVRVEVLG